MITAARLKQLHDTYLDLVRLEIDEFGVRATEVRHLIGRLGEFHCALEVGGTLAQRTNQPGFDVQGADGRCISVKATAQTSGFIAISKSTADKADDLMVVQYLDGSLRTIYFGPMKAAIEKARFYGPSNNYEFDLSRANKLALFRANESRRAISHMEGGAVYTEDRNGKYLVVIDEGASLDVLDAEDRAGLEAITEHAFHTAAARDKYIEDRGWASAV